MAAAMNPLPLPVLPEGWAAEKDFKVVGSLSPATPRNLEPVGPYFLAHARRVCYSLALRTCEFFFFFFAFLTSFKKRHHRTFSEDERIQAQENVKKVEDGDDGEISEPEDPLMLQRDAKDWKVVQSSPLDFIPWKFNLVGSHLNFV